MPLFGVDYNAAAAEEGLIAKVETIPTGEQGRGPYPVLLTHIAGTVASPPVTDHLATILLLRQDGRLEEPLSRSGLRALLAASVQSLAPPTVFSTPGLGPPQPSPQPVAAPKACTSDSPISVPSHSALSTRLSTSDAYCGLAPFRHPHRR